MLEVIKKQKELILYLVFGVLTTLVNIVVYYVCTKLLGINYQISNVIGWILSVTFAYVTNKLYVFESKGKDKKEIIKEALSFYWFRLLSLGMDLLAMYLMVDWIQMDDMFAKVISNGFVIVANYVFSKLFIFKKSE